MVDEKGEPLTKVKHIVYLSLITPIPLKHRDYYVKKLKMAINKLYFSYCRPAVQIPF